MKKMYSIIGLECAHCAAKIENGIKKIKGVNEVNLNYIGQKLTLDIEDDVVDEVMVKINKIIKKVEPDCSLD